MCSRSKRCSPRAIPALALTLALALCSVTACAAPVAVEVDERAFTSQGPTGARARPSVRESYLIPPEIPVGLLNYLFTEVARIGEIISIEVRDHSSGVWTLAITTEKLPDELMTTEKRFAFTGHTWREL